MGVVYKLKTEVINFILQTKKEHPKMGCRKLADLAAEKFDMKISKSSVNTVLQDAHLSGQVGRPPVKSKEKKFEIPKVKKEQIREHLSKLDDQVPEEPAVSDQEDLPSEKQDIGQEAPLSEQRTCLEAGLLWGLMYYWSLARRNPLESMFARFLQKEWNEKAAQIADARLSLSILGLDGLANLDNFEHHVFWQMNGVSKDALQKTRHQWDELWNPNITLQAGYQNEKAQAFKMASGQECIFEDGTCVFLDAQHASIWDNAHAGMTQSIPVAVDQLVEHVLVQSEYFLSGALPHQKELSPAQWAMIGMCLYPDKNPLKEIILLDEDGRELTRFQNIARMPRKVVFGVFPHQKEFMSAAKSIQWAEKILIQQDVLAEAAFITDTRTIMRGQDTRFLTVWTDKKEAIGALLTNDDEAKAGDILEDFLWRLPDFFHRIHYSDSYKLYEQKTGVSFKGKGAVMAEESETIEPEQFKSMEGLIHDFQSAVYSHFTAYLMENTADVLSYDQVKSMLSSLKGTLQEDDETVRLTLDIPQDHQNKALLLEKIHLFSQKRVFSRQNKHVIVKSKILTKK